jgi:hypothetical protein
VKITTDDLRRLREEGLEQYRLHNHDVPLIALALHYLPVALAELDRMAPGLWFDSPENGDLDHRLDPAGRPA